MPLLVKDVGVLTLVAGPVGRLAVVVLVVLVDVDVRVAVVVRATVEAECAADRLVATASVVGTRVHHDGIADGTAGAAVLAGGPEVLVLGFLVADGVVPTAGRVPEPTVPAAVECLDFGGEAVFFRAEEVLGERVKEVLREKGEEIGGGCGCVGVGCVGGCVDRVLQQDHRLGYATGEGFAGCLVVILSPSWVCELKG